MIPTGGAVQHRAVRPSATVRLRAVPMRRMSLFTCVVVAFAVTAFAGDQPATNTSTAPSFTGALRASDLTSAPKGLGFSLLDPSRLRMHQSYSLSYFSGSGASGSVGLYMNTLEYDLFKPLTVRVGLGYVHSPFGISGQSGSASLSNGSFLPSFGLFYHPSDKFFFSVDYRTLPSYAWPITGSGSSRVDSHWDLYNPWPW